MYRNVFSLFPRMFTALFSLVQTERTTCIRVPIRRHSVTRRKTGQPHNAVIVKKERQRAPADKRQLSIGEQLFHPARHAAIPNSISRPSGSHTQDSIYFSKIDPLLHGYFVNIFPVRTNFFLIFL